MAAAREVAFIGRLIFYRKQTQEKLKILNIELEALPSMMERWCFDVVDFSGAMKKAVLRVVSFPVTVRALL